MSESIPNTKISYIHTPKDWQEIMKWIHLHNVNDRAHLVTAAGMAWNLAMSNSDQESCKNLKLFPPLYLEKENKS
mgnify:CR=1 FL=1